MFYQLSQPTSFDGISQYIDISQLLHRFLHTDTLSVNIDFRTNDVSYPSLLAVYFKESILPDFSLSLFKGRTAITILRNGKLKILTGGEPVCDGKTHRLAFRGQCGSIKVWIDGKLIIEDNAPGPWCKFGYVGFATVGRATRAEQYTFFRGEILSLDLSQQILPITSGYPAGEHTCTALFAQHDSGVENYRIPSLLSCGGTTIASADARMEAPGDNPNHICRAIRLSTDSGNSWDDIRLFCDFGGIGRDDGAAAVDGALLYDRETDTVFQLYSHTSRGIGAFSVAEEGAFDASGRKLLWDASDNPYYLENGCVYHEDGTPTTYAVDPYGNLKWNGVDAGSICHGEKRILRQANVSFLHLIRSDDHGKTWSEPVDLTPQVKAAWMRFVGAGPGTGIQVTEGAFAGRLIYPVYYHNRHKIASSGVIYSDDHGSTWHMGGSVNQARVVNGVRVDTESCTDPKANLGECQVAELPGGSIRIMLRNSYGNHTLTAISNDGGETWTDVKSSGLPDPQCQSHLLRVIHKGRPLWLFSNPAHSGSRVQGTIRASFDGGETWPISKLVVPGEFAYSCLSQLPDGQIGLLYEGHNLDQCFLKFPLDWLLQE